MHFNKRHKKHFFKRKTTKPQGCQRRWWRSSPPLLLDRAWDDHCLLITLLFRRIMRNSHNGPYHISWHWHYCEQSNSGASHTHTALCYSGRLSISLCVSVGSSPPWDHPTQLNPHYHFSTPSSWIYFCLLLSRVSVHPVPLLLLLPATICHLCVTCGAPPACPQHPSLSILVPLLYLLFFFVLSIFHFLIFISFFVVSLTFSSCIWPF